MIDKNSPIPVYYQLKNDLIKKLQKGFGSQGNVFQVKESFVKSMK